MEKVENKFEITETELNKIFAYVISKPINEAMELYAICQEVGKRSIISEEDKKGTTEKESK